MEVPLIDNVRFLKGFFFFFFPLVVQLNNTTDNFLSPLNELEYVKIWGMGGGPKGVVVVVTHTVKILFFLKINLEQPTHTVLFFKTLKQLQTTTVSDRTLNEYHGWLAGSPPQLLLE
jgi:hypothetical protein